MNLTYEKNGDYLILTLQADIQPEGTVTKYGMMRETCFTLRIVSGESVKYFV